MGNIAHGLSGDRLLKDEEKILKLARLLRELRSLVINVLKERKWTAADIARQTNINRSAIERIVSGRNVVVASSAIEPICSLLEREDLGKDIIREASGLPDTTLGVAIYPDIVITTAVTIQRAFSDAGSPSWFPSLFGAGSEVVRGALMHSKASLHMLEKETVRADILGKINDPKFREEIAAVRAKEKDLQEEQTKRFMNLYSSLKVIYRSQTHVAVALTIHRDTLKRAMSGKGTMESQTNLIAKAELLMKQHTEEQEQPSAPVTSVTEVKNPMLALAGETSPLGVRYVIGPASFKAIGGQLSDTDISFVVKQIELARALLNICAELDDDKHRSTIRQSLAPEVEELELAIRLFTEKFPNRLAPLHEAQRLTWARKHPNRELLKGKKK